jgi:hypothetical protein
LMSRPRKAAGCDITIAQTLCFRKCRLAVESIAAGYAAQA